MNQQRQNLFETMCKSDGLVPSLSHFASQYDDVKVVAALANVKFPSCKDFRGELASLSRHAENADASYVYALLSDICSLRLEEEGARLKYVPFAVFPDRCSFRIEEVSEHVAALLDELARRISDPILRVRVADVAYERTNHHAREIRRDRILSLLNAYCAQKTYCRMNWRTYGKTSWRRLVELSRSTGSLGNPFLKDVTSRFYEALQGLQGEDAADVCEFIVEQNLDCRQNRDLIRGKLVQAHEDAIGESKYLAQDAVSQTLIRLAGICGDKEAECLALMRRGTGWMTDGDACVARGDLVMAAHRYEVAEKWYRKIPMDRRGEIEDKIRHCIEGKRNGYMKWASEWQRVTVLSQDISKEVAAVEEIMDVADPNDAMIRFAHICDFNLLEFERAVMVYSDSLGAAKLFPVVQLAPDGRVEVQTDGDDPVRIESECFTCLWLTHAVKARILPAYNVARRFCFDRQYFRDMVKDSSVPKDREESVALGLWLGFLGEWRAASSVLIPQVENIIRLKFRDAGADVLHAKNGSSVEDYTSLSKLLERTEAPAVLGCVDHKELLLLFGAAPNLNWRNNIAHGLIEDAPAGQFCPVDAYVWHRFLRFVLTAHQLANYPKRFAV